MVGGVGRAFVEDHRDVGVEHVLDAHGFLGRQEQAVAVDRRLEPDSLLADLAQRTEGKDLKTAGVGEDRPIPAHEAVQAAMRSDDFEPGAQPEVEGVAEADLRSRRGQVAGRHCLDRSVGADRHEGRRVHCAVGESEAAATSSTVTGQKLEVHVIKGVSASSSRRPQQADSADVRRCTSSVSGNPSPSSGLPAKQKEHPWGPGVLVVVKGRSASPDSLPRPAQQRTGGEVACQPTRESTRC
jgi:hypothetical protein